MCGPADDEKQKAKREKFLDEFSSACAKTVCESTIFSLSASSPIFDGRQQSISVPARPRSRRHGRNKNHQSKWIH
jgi:hypothetical protein